MTKHTQIIIGLLILIAGGIWLYTATEQKQHTGTDNTATTTESAETPDSWERYGNTTYNFSIAHPPEATVQAEGIDEQNHIKFMYLGSPQATGHINDGFTLTVSTYDKNDVTAETLNAFVDSQLSEQREASKVLQQPRETNFNGRAALQYEIESIGRINTTAVETNTAFVTISHSITDPNDAGYEQMVADMKDSLEFSNITQN